jgi:hypothetical protein
MSLTFGEGHTHGLPITEKPYGLWYEMPGTGRFMTIAGFGRYNSALGRIPSAVKPLRSHKLILVIVREFSGELL